MKKLFITGGAGYVGAVLVPYLLEKGYTITTLDLMIYGEDVLKKHKNLKIIKGDIRDIKLLEKVIPGHDTLIHLACISNDPSFELDPQLGKSINFDSFEPMVKISKQNNIKNFIYASSSSVYGIKNEANVTENSTLEPLTDYSKYKADCEEILLNYGSDDFISTILRPATVCGYSRRQRLDVVVNILTNLAFHRREITVLGGNQLRPNIHIDDMVNSYIKILDSSKEKISNKIFNVGFENQTVNELSFTVRDVIGNDVKIIKKETNDNRSYHISSEKIKDELGFITKRSIKDAVIDLKKAFETKILTNTLENENYFNIKRMQSINLK